MEPIDIKRVGIWIRVSTEYQNDADAPEVHKARAEAYALSKGWEISEIYRLIISGKSVMEHSETQRMMHDIEVGHINAIIFSRLARLARSLKDLLVISEFFEKNNAYMISLSESIDTSTPAGKLLFNITGAMAQWEREEISIRAIESVKTRAKMGRPLGGAGLFGYKWVDKKLIINQDEAMIVKDIYDTFIGCRKINTTAMILNNKGYRTRHNALWTDTSVRRILQDPTYQGLHFLNYTKSMGDKKKWTLRPKDQWIPLNVEPIISPVVYQEVNSYLNTNSIRRIRRKNVYLLSGLIFCSICGSKMYGFHYGKSKPYYKCMKCSGKIGIPEIENIIIKRLRKYKFKLKHLIGMPKKYLKELVVKKNTLTKEVNNIEAEINTLIGLYQKKLVNDFTFKPRIDELENRHKSLIEQISEIEEDIIMKKLKEQNSTIINQMKSIGEIFPTLNQEQKIIIIKDIVESIKIGKDTIEINFYLINFLKKNLDVLKKFNESAGVHGRGEHEARGIGQGHLGPADRHETVFQWLAQDLDNVLVELRQFVEE